MLRNLSDGLFVKYLINNNKINTAILIDKKSYILKENGQISQSASLIDEDNDLMRVSIIWVYRDKNAYEACQKFHSQWAKIGGDFIGKASFYRGEQIWEFC